MVSDVLIIGGWVIGLSIARELKRRGVKQITLIERGSIGGEASWAAAGMLAPNIEANATTIFIGLELIPWHFIRISQSLYSKKPASTSSLIGAGQFVCPSMTRKQRRSIVLTACSVREA
jgi:glycine/D-amino acid oxidase-like deaminating enzyme